MESKKAILCLFLVGVAYVIAGFFTDIPPRGISLEGTRTVINLLDTEARIDTRLDYVCHSWRRRWTSVYLPFGEFGATGLEAVLPERASHQQFDDGVILHLAMLPDTRQTAEFRFTQPVRGKRFHYMFSLARGWPVPPNLVEYEVRAAPGRELRFSVPVEREEEVSGEMVYRMSGIQDREGLVIEWD